ncbi:radial spoke head protein, putative [Plasmodium relictum]|uniref:Radial spoke head protein, putative n=1 Tax=Plasmodium relictum TaxID=85471 RepID=A0A1J1H586_PLARL|nr:radial spoke head protein, putative [Plasmodium relictum]CRG99922.1 radial spoke head protein, putative [Plasmodium relictum]
MRSNLILSLNNAKDFLKNKNKDGYSVYDHICELINFIVVEKPEKCYENFELISNHIKERKKRSDKILSEKEIDKSNLDNYILNEYIKKKKEWLEKLKLLFIKNSEIKPINLPFMRDFYEQIKLINWAGYHIKKNIICYLNNSIKNILEKYKDELKSLNFWGILKGIKNDYYILEGELKDKKDISFLKKKDSEKYSDTSYDEVLSSNKSSPSTDDSKDTSQKMKQKKKKNTEKKKKINKFSYKKEDYEYFNKKVNKNVYWVSINGKDEWVLLKFTAPQYIKITNKINKMLTGDLNHIITSFPKITIKEKHYLRAIISIISANTHISPKNYYILKQKNKDKENSEEEKQKNKDEDENEVEEYEEKENNQEQMRDDTHGEIIENKKFQFETNSLLNVNNWVYFRYNFLPNGHISYPKNIIIKKSKKIKNIIKKNPPLKILRNINSENHQQNNYAWRIKHLNPGGYYGKNNLHYDIIIIYNLLYYGAFTIYFNKQFFNFYIGNGIKLQHTYLHTYAPGKIQSDKSELSEVDQIN